MSTFENSILGDVKGKVGEVIGRTRNGKYFIYATPKEVKISNSPEAIKSRDIMKTAAKFASTVNSIPELKHFWFNSKIIAFDAFHKIEKVNYPFFLPERPTLNNTIIPDINEDNKIKEASISPKGIKLKILISKIEEPKLYGAKELTGIGVICYFTPKDKTIDYFHLSKISASPFDVKIDEQFEVEIPFSEKERSNYNSNRNSILYFTFVSKDNTGTPLKFCCNYRNEFTHEITGEKERFFICDSQP